MRALAAVLSGLLACAAAHATDELAVSAEARGAAEQAQALMRECRYDDADAAIAAAMTTATPEDRKLLLLAAGMLAEHRNDTATALRNYEEAASGKEVPIAALRMLGRAQVANRDFAAGHESLKAYVSSEIKAQKRLPLREDLAALAVAAAELGKLPEALQLLDLVLERLSPLDPLVIALRARVQGAVGGGAAPEAGAYWRLAYGGEHSIGAPATDFALLPLRRTAPEYPRDAARNGVQGSVLLHIRIDEWGNVASTRVLKSTPPRVFDAAARAAVAKWKFRPHVVDCKAVPSEGTQQIDFRISE